MSNRGTASCLIATVVAAVSGCLGVALPLHAATPLRAAPPTVQRYTLCAASALKDSELGHIEYDLSTRLAKMPGISKIAVSRASSRCVSVRLTARGGARGAVIAAGRVGDVVTADGAQVQLQPGERVRLVCPRPGCSPGVKAGKAKPTAHPPILSVDVPARDVVPRSVRTIIDAAGTPSVLYSLDAAGSRAWCSFTRSNTGSYAPSIVDGLVVIDPTIESPICGGPTEITGLQSTTQAHEIAGYLITGPLPVALRLRS